MSNLLYWVVPVVVVTVLGLLIALVERRPKGPNASVENFSRKLNAMSSMKHVDYNQTNQERREAV